MAMPVALPRPGARALRRATRRAGIRPRHSIHDSIIHRMAGGSAAASRPPRAPARAAEGRKAKGGSFTFRVLGAKNGKWAERGGN